MSIYRLAGVAPALGRGCWVADSASVIGAVRMEEQVSIWFGAVVRGDNEPIRIGAGTNVQDNAVLHSDPGAPLGIGRNCTIGHQAVVHGCSIGDNTLIGMGAIVLNGAVIGSNCIVGAGTLVTEGKVVPDGALVVGAPGRVVRQLSAEEIARNAASARHYVDNASRFAAALELDEAAVQAAAR